MPWFVPHILRVLIGFLDNVLISPLIVLRLVNNEGFISRHGGIIIIGELEPVVIVASSFPNAKIFCISECVNITLV